MQQRCYTVVCFKGGYACARARSVCASERYGMCVRASLVCACALRPDREHLESK